jgi:glutaredoxin
MKLIRWILGKIIISIDLITRSTPIKRDTVTQEKINTLSKQFSLYHFNACPFCVKVRRHLHHKALNIELRDAKNNLEHKQTLIEEGGRHKVPCLRIQQKNSQVTWLYESTAIIAYLDEELRSI